MSNNLQLFEFNGKAVAFELSNETVMVNATEMAKIFGKQVNEFTTNKDTIAFINECLKNGNSRFLFPEYADNEMVVTEEMIISSRQKTGTWMHRVLALKFAAWLNPTFELWVYSTIDELLFGKYRQMEASIKLSAERRNHIEQLKKELAHDERFLALERLQLEERQASYSRGKTVSAQLTLFSTALAN